MAKKNANGQGTFRYIESKKIWEGRIRLGDVRKSVYGSTQAEVRKKITAIQAQYDTGYYSEPTRITLAEWAQIWLDDYMMGKRASTVAQYTTYIKGRILPTLGKCKLADLSTPRIQHLYNELLKSVQPKTVRNIHGILHSMLDKAVQINYIKFNPCDACELPKVVQREMHPIIDEKLKRFLQEIEHHKYGSLYYVATFTGMRQGEVLGLSWDCIDFKRGTVRLYRQLIKVRNGHGLYEFGPLKTRQERFIKPAQQVMDMLKRVRSEQAQMRLKCGESWDNSMNLVFTQENGKHLCYDSVYGCFKRIVARLDMPEVRLHDLRHTFCTLSVEAGIDLKTISETVGHATVAFTQDRYGHVSDRMRDKAADNMAALINDLG